MLITQKRETIVVYRIDTQHGVAMFVAEDAAAFYLHHGFVPSFVDGRTLMLQLYN